LLKPMARGRVSLTARDAAPPLVEFNFTGHELDLQRLVQGFRRAVEILAHEKVRAMSGVTFPVKFDDRLRRLNRITTANRVQSAIIAALIDLVPPLAARSSRRSLIGALISPHWSRTTRRWPSMFAKTSPACSIPWAPAAWARRTIAMRWSTRRAACAGWAACGSSTPRSCRR
jgi:hypothetical protein